MEDQNKAKIDAYLDRAETLERMAAQKRKEAHEYESRAAQARHKAETLAREVGL